MWGRIVKEGQNDSCEEGNHLVGKVLETEQDGTHVTVRELVSHCRSPHSRNMEKVICVRVVAIP